MANYPQVRLIKGDDDGGRALIDRVFASGSDKHTKAIKLALWFYRLAHFGEDYPQAATELLGLIKTGVRSKGWDFSENIARAKQGGQANLSRLTAFAALISDEADIATLTDDIADDIADDE